MTAASVNASRDAKLNALERLLTRRTPERKWPVFTQFADTVRYSPMNSATGA